jgi:hypothetical protein
MVRSESSRRRVCRVGQADKKLTISGMLSSVRSFPVALVRWREERRERRRRSDDTHQKDLETARDIVTQATLRELSTLLQPPSQHHEHSMSVTEILEEVIQYLPSLVFSSSEWSASQQVQIPLVPL